MGVTEYLTAGYLPIQYHWTHHWLLFHHMNVSLHKKHERRPLLVNETLENHIIAKVNEKVQWVNPHINHAQRAAHTLSKAF